MWEVREDWRDKREEKEYAERVDTPIREGNHYLHGNSHDCVTQYVFIGTPAYVILTACGTQEGWQRSDGKRIV